MALITSMIGLATLAVSPVWMQHGCSFVRGLENNHENSSRPSFSQGILAGLEGLPTSEVRGLCVESFLRQHPFHRKRRRAVGYLLLLLLWV